MTTSGVIQTKFAKWPALSPSNLSTHYKRRLSGRLFLSVLARCLKFFGTFQKSFRQSRQRRYGITGIREVIPPKCRYCPRLRQDLASSVFTLTNDSRRNLYHSKYRCMFCPGVMARIFCDMSVEYSRYNTISKSTSQGDRGCFQQEHSAIKPWRNSFEYPLGHRLRFHLRFRRR